MLTTRTVFAWLVDLEAPEAAVERQDALRNGAALAQLAVSDGLIAGDEHGHGQLAMRLGELRRDGWLSLDWQAMPPPGDEEPTAGRMYQAAHLQRMDNIRLSPQGLVAHAARASSSPTATTAPAASIMRATAATAPDDELRDAFISHAGEDKDEVARPLMEALKDLGRSVWFDEAELVVGDSLSSSIDRGLATSRFGVVVLSEHFFAKNWPLRELQGLVAREMAGGERLILPVWHRIDAQYLAGVAPPLADLVAADTGDGIRVVAERISSAINRRRVFESARGRPMPARRPADAPPDREQELAPALLDLRDRLVGLLRANDAVGTRELLRAERRTFHSGVVRALAECADSMGGAVDAHELCLLEARLWELVERRAATLLPLVEYAPERVSEELGHVAALADVILPTRSTLPMWKAATRVPVWHLVYLIGSWAVADGHWTAVRALWDTPTSDERPLAAITQSSAERLGEELVHARPNTSISSVGYPLRSPKVRRCLAFQALSCRAS